MDVWPTKYPPAPPSVPPLWGSADDQVLLSVPEVCAATGLSRSTVYRLMSAGELVSVKVDGRRMVADRDLRYFVDQLSKDARQTGWESS